MSNMSNMSNMSSYINPSNPDQGPNPFVIDIDRATKCNGNYSTTIWTGANLQTTLMCIPVGSDIGLEKHPDSDQFLRIESGRGMAVMGACEDKLDSQCCVCDGYAVFVPAGTWHNVINTGNCPLKLCSIYAPPHHPYGTIHKTKEQAEKEGD